MASTSIPDASGELKKGVTFASIFWSKYISNHANYFLIGLLGIWKSLGYRFPDNKRYVYMFEMLTDRYDDHLRSDVTISHRNIIIVRPNKDSLILHGVRDMDTLKEIDPADIAKRCGYELVKSHHFDSQEAMIKFARTLNPLQSGKWLISVKVRHN